MKHVDDIMNIEGKSKNTIHCLDRQFTGLGSEEIIPLGKNSEDFSHLENCVNNSCGTTHKTVFVVGNIIRIRRQEDLTIRFSIRWSRIVVFSGTVWELQTMLVSLAMVSELLPVNLPCQGICLARAFMSLRCLLSQPVPAITHSLAARACSFFVKLSSELPYKSSLWLTTRLAAAPRNKACTVPGA